MTSDSTERKQQHSDAISASCRTASRANMRAQDGVVRLPDRHDADPVALALLDHVRALPVAQQHRVFQVASRRLGKRDASQGEEACAALTACMTALGLRRSPSRSEYRAWQRQEPDGEWPTDHTVSVTLGGWTALRAEIDNRPVADLQALALGSRCDQLSTEAVLAALQAWPADGRGPMLRYSDFRRWVERERDAERELLRRCPSKSTIERKFGSWGAALGTAGLLEDISVQQLGAVLKCASTPDTNILQFLQEADRWSQEIYHRHPTASLLDEYRMEKLEANRQARDWRGVPTVTTITDRFGPSLNDALRAAGVLTDQDAITIAVARGTELTTYELAAHVRACAAVLDIDDPRRMTRRQIRDLRQRLIVALGRPVPSDLTICRRFATTGWDKAVPAAMSITVSGQDVDTLARTYRDAMNHTDPNTGMSRPDDGQHSRPEQSS